MREGCAWECACACALHWESVVVIVEAAWCGCADDVWLCCVVLVAVWCCVVLHACVRDCACWLLLCVVPLCVHVVGVCVGHV